MTSIGRECLATVHETAASFLFLVSINLLDRIKSKALIKRSLYIKNGGVKRNIFEYLRTILTWDQSKSHEIQTHYHEAQLSNEENHNGENQNSKSILEPILFYGSKS